MRPTCRPHDRDTVSWRATANERVAGVGSSTPSGLIDATEKTCPPCASGAGANGVAHATGMLSIRQRNVEPATVDVNAKLGVEFHVVPVGPRVIVVSGGPAIVNVAACGALALPRCRAPRPRACACPG